jgi:CheY-like chemotaxis protein
MAGKKTKISQKQKTRKSHKHVTPRKAGARRIAVFGRQKPSVMVVDDEESILLLVKEILEQEGMKVTTATGGMECLDMLEHTKPDLLILDVMMSKITGLDVAEAVRLDPALRDIKIIFLTVVRSMEIKPYLLNKLAASDYISKPFDKDDFVSRVRWALSGK